MEAVDTTLDEPSPPLVDRRATQLEPLGHLRVRSALRAGQHDAAPHRQSLCARRAARPPLKRVALIVGQDQLGKLRATSSSHASLPSSSKTTTRTRDFNRKFLTGDE